MLIESGVRPIIIFDGQPLEMKKSVDDKRRAMREKAHRDALEYKRKGKLLEAKMKFL